MKTADVKNLYHHFVLGTYSPYDVCIVKGKGSKVWDIHGKEYLDFFPGWAVSGLGHCHPSIMSAVRNQVGKIIHIPNIYFNLKQAELAKEIVENSFPSRVFFCNSGAEAVEAAIKFVRKWGNAKGKYEIITMEKSFHGRTLGAMMATGQQKFHEGFDPLPGGFHHVPFNDFDTIKEKVNEKTAAIMLEPVQGEGGIRIADPEYLKKIRNLCIEKEILLIFDEIQTGMGRTGTMFAYQNFGVVPDLMTLAKSLGGGLPIGALVVNEKTENVLVPGTHASTFGGSPLVCAAGLAVFKTIQKEKLLSHVDAISKYFVEKLNGLKAKFSKVKEIRNLGLMIGIELDNEATPIMHEAREKGLLINATQETVLRIIPAINVTKKEINQAIEILNETFEEHL